MIKAEQIPYEVVEVLRENILHDCSFKHAIAAALDAWPDAFITKYSEGAPAFNLPLTQENSNGSD